MLITRLYLSKINQTVNADMRALFDVFGSDLVVSA